MSLHDELNALMAKVLSGEASEQETAELQAWAERDATVARAWKQASALWARGANLPTEDLRDQPPANVDAAWKNVQRRIHTQPQLMRTQRGGLFGPNWTIWAVAASVAFVVIALGQWFRNSTRNQTYSYITLNQERIVRLPDSSRMIVRPMSRLDVDSTHFLANRYIQVIDGEGIFEVRKRNGQPFIVETAEARIRVLGTLFGVIQEPGRTGVWVAVGRVSVSRLDAQRHVVDSIILTDKQSALVTSDSLGYVAPLKVFIQEPDQSAPIVQADFKFQNESLGEASAELSKVYGRPVTVKDPALAERRVTGVYRKKTLGQVVAVWKDLYGLDTLRRGDTLVLTVK